MAPRKNGRGHTGASQQVLTYLREHANTVIPYPELHKAINAEDKFTVPNAITHLVAKGLPIERPIRGFAVYRTLPQATFEDSKGLEVPDEPVTPTQKLYEYVGESRGIVIVKGEDNELYVVAPLVEFMAQP